MTRHFHALPITPDATLRELKGMSFLVSHATTAKHQIGLVDGIAEEVRLDCGAFSHYNALLSQGLTADQIDEAQLAPRRWDAYYAWCEQWCARPTTRAIIPDVINAPGQIQDALLKEWPLPKWKGIPVYHIHLPTDRLLRDYVEGGDDARILAELGEAADALAELTAINAVHVDTNVKLAALTDRLTRELEDQATRVRAAICGEYLTDDTGEPEDVAYQEAINAVLAAVELVLSRDQSDLTETGRSE